MLETLDYFIPYLFFGFMSSMVNHLIFDFILWYFFHKYYILYTRG